MLVLEDPNVTWVDLKENTRAEEKKTLSYWLPIDYWFN